MAKLKLDLHDIYNDSRALDEELNRIIQEAVRKKIGLVEIIPGKGSGQLKKNPTQNGIHNVERLATA
jgi:DNA-nicking Smr family endonuclease